MSKFKKLSITDQNSKNIIVLKNVNKRVVLKDDNKKSKYQFINILDDINLEIKSGDFCLLVGRSGSGKSTLLNIIAGLDSASGGSVEISGADIAKYNTGQLTKYRANIGIVFQSYYLLPNLNVEENILMGLWARGQKTDQDALNNLIKTFGLEERRKSKVETLSGGEKQRVAIARAVVAGCDLILCDEPTGALDSKNEDSVIELLLNLNKMGKTIVCVTHNNDFETFASRIIRLNDGKISEITTNY